MKLKRMLTIPGLAASALILGACSFSGSVDVGPFPNEEAREVTARTATDPAAVNVTVGSNSSELFLVNIPASVAESDVVWFEARDANGVSSLMLYSVSGVQEREILRSVAPGWFDEPRAIDASPATVTGVEPAQSIGIDYTCSGPCIAIAGDDAGSSRYVRVNATGSGAEFDLYVFGRDFDREGGATRSEAVRIELGDDGTEVGAISLSGAEQWYRAADNTATVTFTETGSAVAAGDMAFEARVYEGDVLRGTLNAESDFLNLGAPTNNVFIQVRSFNDTRAAAAGNARFTLTVR